MIPVGYMAKHVCKRPDWLQAPHVSDIYSASNCICKDFANYIPFWKHNGYWLFDSPEIIKSVAQENSISLEGTSLFYYEAYELEFDGEKWKSYGPERSFVTNVEIPVLGTLDGFDVVNFTAGNSPECSGLSCSSLAAELPTNSHCLLASFAEAKRQLETGAFGNSEPGPYRIFAVFSVNWS
jgi:hypothetical protein